MVDQFAESMQKLINSAGISVQDLEQIKAGILALAEDDPMFTPDDPCDCEECWLCELQREQAVSIQADWQAEKRLER